MSESRYSLVSLERWLVLLIAAHSVMVGLMLVLAPAWSIRFAGWAGAEPLFFARQAGAFHLVVAIGYVIEHLRSGGITLLVCTKTIAFVFLIGAVLMGEEAWSVPFSGVADGAMGALVWAVHRRAVGATAARAV
jgi:hypothetical protein